MKKANFLFCLLAGLMAFSSCHKLSSEKEILSFQFANPNVTADIRSDGKIEAEMPYGTDLTNLTPIITVSEKATISPMSGEPVDFTNPVTYTVTAEDGSQSVYSVVVTKEKNSEKRIVAFRFASLNIDAVINEDTKEIEAKVPYGTDVTTLVPTIIISDDASVAPCSDYVTDFSQPVTYTVTAEDGSQVEYVVTVIVEQPENLIIGVWGVEKIEYYNTDYAGNPIAASMSTFLFEPYSTDNGIQLYFREDKSGEMRDSSIEELWLDWNEETESYETHIICPDTVLVSNYAYAIDEESGIMFLNMDNGSAYRLQIKELSDDVFIYENEYYENYFEKAYLKRISDTPSKSAGRKAESHPRYRRGSLLGKR